MLVALARDHGPVDLEGPLAAEYRLVGGLEEAVGRVEGRVPAEVVVWGGRIGVLEHGPWVAPLADRVGVYHGLDRLLGGRRVVASACVT